MRKISLLLVLCVLLACFASCGGDDTNTPEPTGTNVPEETTEAPKDTEEPTEEATETDAPETPNYDWTMRY